MVEIEKLRKEDFVTFLNLLFEIFPNRYNPVTFMDLYENYPDGMLVAKINGKIVGFLVGVRTSRYKARVLLLGVKEGFRRMGIGSLLLRRFLTEMAIKGIKQVELEVRASNQVALSFYIKHGFSIAKLIKELYEDGEDGYLMVKVL